METMTVGELIDKLKNLPRELNVYMLTDKTDGNWDEDREQWLNLHGIEYVRMEYIRDEMEDETNVILEVE